MKTNFLIFFILSLLLTSCEKNKERQSYLSKNESKTINIVEVKKGNILNYLEENGILKSQKVVKVKSNYSGRVLEILKEEGDVCIKNEVIALVELSMEQIKEFTSMEINYQKAYMEFQRTSNELLQIEELYKQGLVSRAQHEEALKNYEITKAELYKAKLDKKIIMGNSNSDTRKNIKIFAPIGGVIIKKNFEIGEYLPGKTSEGIVIFEIADMNKMIVQAEINEFDILHIKSGADVDISIESIPGKIFKGRIAKIFPSPINEKNIIKYKVNINPTENFTTPLKIGMSTFIRILLEEKKNILMLPIGTVVRDSETKIDSVLIPGTNGLYKRVFIETGIMNEDFIEIKKGLKEGDKVVENPYEITDDQIEIAKEFFSTNKNEKNFR